MAYKHIGTATTLAAIATADISNGDIAYIWLNSYNCKMVFDSASTKATDIVNRPYCQRPSDYSSAGVWVEDCGANEVLSLSGDQVRQGCIISNNWIDGTSGMKIDLDNEQILIKDDTFGADGIQLGWFSSAYKFHVGDANSFIKWDGAALSATMASGETFDLYGGLNVYGGGDIEFKPNSDLILGAETGSADANRAFIAWQVDGKYIYMASDYDNKNISIYPSSNDEDCNFYIGVDYNGPSTGNIIPFDSIVLTSVSSSAMFAFGYSGNLLYKNASVTVSGSLTTPYERLCRLRSSYGASLLDYDAAILDVKIDTTREPIIEIYGYFVGNEFASDPSDPSEGKWVMWMSDGTGAGDDGDIMVKVTAGSTTKTITLIDFSAF